MSPGTDTGPRPDAYRPPGAATYVRFTSLSVEDPPAAVSNTLIGANCNMNLFETPNPTIMITPAINDGLQAALDNDSDGNGFLDFSIIASIGDLATVQNGGALQLYLGDCVPGGACTNNPSLGLPPIPLPFTYQDTGPCATNPVVEPEAVRAGAHNPGDDAPCIRAVAPPIPGGIRIPISQMGLNIEIPLYEISAQAEVETDGTLTDGLLRGFLRLSDAQMIVLNDDFGYDITLNLALPGGVDGDQTIRVFGIDIVIGVCGDSGDTTELTCANRPTMSCVSDLDTDSDGNQGWWMYLNFGASPIAFTP